MPNPKGIFAMLAKIPLGLVQNRGDHPHNISHQNV